MENLGNLERFELYEFYNKQRLQTLLDSNSIIEQWNEDDLNNHHHKSYKSKFDGEREQLRWILDNLDKDGLLKVEYKRYNEIGRYYIQGKVGYTILRRLTRNYLCDGLYYDLDMKKAHLSLMFDLILKNEWNNEFPTITNFYNLYEKQKIGIKNALIINDEEFKNLMIEIMFGFDIKKKCEKILTKYRIVETRNLAIAEFIKNYIKELKLFTNKCKELNLFQIDTSNKTFNEGGSWLSKFLQTLEANLIGRLKNHISMTIPNIYLFKRTNKKIGTYEYDGLKLLKTNVDKNGGITQILNSIDNWLSENGYNQISFSNKSMDEKLKVEVNCKMSEEDEIVFDDENEDEITSPTTIITEFSPIVMQTETNEELLDEFIIPVNTLVLGTNDISKFVSNELSKILKYLSQLEIWFCYNEETHFWKKTKKPDAIISTFLQKAINTTRKKLINQQTINLSTGKSSNENIEKDLKICCTWYQNATNKTRLSEIKDFLITYINDDNFIDKLDNNKYELVFQNGILDLKTMIFRNELCKEDYLTKCIPFDYTKPSNDDVNNVKNELLKICNNNTSHLDYYLLNIAYALTGDADKEQIFSYFRGQSASNGKSVILEALEEIMPNYVKKAENKLFDVNFDMKKELPNFYGKRIIWINELTKLKKDADRMKSFADGTTYSFGRNYATESEKLNVTFKLFIVSNYSLNIDADNGIIRRFKLCQFNSKFDDCYEEDNYEKLEFKKDNSFRTKLMNELKLPLIELLAEYANKYWNEKKLNEYYPTEWKEEGDENMQDNNKFDGWFYDNFTFNSDELKSGEDLFIGKNAMENMLPSDMRNIKISDELKRMRLNFEYKKDKRYSGKKGCYIGFGLKKIDENED